jgi:peptidoglycan/xylan/chitin deacetylase (PgdA/CDA1 family)
MTLDTYARNDLTSVKAGLDRAMRTGEVIELYAHDPGRSVGWDELEAVLAEIARRGLPFFTYADIARHSVAPSAGVLLSFDDANVASWVEGIPLYASYGARLTFFVAFFDRLDDNERAGLHELANAGHAVEAHSMRHLRAPLYVERNGVGAYLEQEALPSIQLLEADGFDVTSYAYPYGARTGELDRALLNHVDLVRSVAFTWTGPADPCPD